MSSASFYRWRVKCGEMEASIIKRIKELENENRRLKKMYIEEKPIADFAKDIIDESCKASSSPRTG